MTFTIEELAIPASIDEPGGADFARSIEVGNAVYTESYGTDELNYEPAEELPHYRDAFSPHRLLVARVEGEIVGRGIFESLVDDDADVAWLNVEVLPAFRGRGIGRALADGIEEITRGEGRTKAICYLGVRDAEGERLPSPTGFGGVPADDVGVRFLLGRGYRLEQVERASRLALPVSDLDERLAEAERASGPDYRAVFWFGATPPEWREDLALMGTRMSTDAPSAGLEEPEDVWTVERIIAADERDAASPRTRCVAAALHVPSGRLAGFTTLSVPLQRHRSVAQYATLVLREHRGHRLGMLLKLANLAHLERVAPGHPSVTTFNAEENRYMLDVNEAMGFVPFAYEGAFRKDL